MEQFPLRRDFGEGSMKPQVFINFRGDELRHRFVNYLKKALVRNGINTYTDSDEQKGHNLKVFFKRIEDSTIALVIFSSMYTESEWCLDELAKMKECMESTNLVVIPIFYLVAPFTVRNQMGDFGDKFRMLVLKDVDDVRKNMWTEALKSIAENTGIEYDGKRYQT
ncbi:hypothetical protein N665_0012s0262 [Sinapis alba]|nr:hypothetical protein N665_0012s0262 [Sinapis alba]